jgi:chorismate mutase
VEGFFIAQISVAKAIQYRYRADLLSQPSDRAPLDLNEQIRPALIKLGNLIIAQMATTLGQDGPFKASQRELFFQALQHRYISDADKQLLFDGLLGVKMAK